MCLNVIRRQELDWTEDEWPRGNPGHRDPSLKSRQNTGERNSDLSPEAKSQEFLI